MSLNRGRFAGPELVIVNGQVITMDRERTTAEAVAVKFGRIAAVGTTEEVLKLSRPSTRVIDVEGRAVLPGFIDTHMHVVSAGRELEAVNCRTPPNRSIADVLERLRERAATTPAGEWIICRGYNLGLSWETEGRHINRWDIDSVAPHHPVQINSVGGHTGSIYNSQALEKAGVNRNTPDPAPPAVIERDPETGEPSGRVSEAAEEALQALIPAATNEEREEAVRRAAGQFVAWGLTSVTDAASYPEALRTYQKLARSGSLPVRVGVLLHRTTRLRAGEQGSGNTGEVLDVIKTLANMGIRVGFGDDRVRLLGVKIFADGAFTGRTAAMYEPYEGEPVDPSSPQYRGLLHVPPGEIHDAIRRAHLAGLRPCIHAQGDRGIDVVLDGIEAALAAKPVRDHRLRIEHAGLTRPQQLRRIKELGVCVSSSISFLGGDVSTNWQYWGMERMRWSYALRSFQDYGIIAAGNGDCPVTTGNPMVGIATAVTRRAVTGAILGPEQSSSVFDALRLYTTNAAYLNFEEHKKGTLEPGKLADMTVLSSNPLNTEPDQLGELTADLTVVGGKIVFSRL